MSENDATEGFPSPLGERRCSVLPDRNAPEIRNAKRGESRLKKNK